MHIRFHVGGPRFHPVDEQATLISTWLDPHLRLSVRHDTAAFADLDDVDLLVMMGMYWQGMSADWAGNMVYQPPTEESKVQFLRYCDSQRPIIIHHGAIGGYDDWTEFGQRMGVKWGWQRASHSPFQQHRIHVGNSGHALVDGIADFLIEDEIYYKLWMDDARNPKHHLWAEWDGAKHPMLTTLDSNSNVGKAVYIALGHNMRSMEPPAMRTLWRNAVSFLLPQS